MSDEFIYKDNLENQSELMEKYLTFWTDNQLYGVAIANVVQIVNMQTLNPIPEYPDYAKGVINLRGNILPVIDIRLRIGKAEAEYNERTCIVVTNIADASVGFIVDAVDEVCIIKEAQISPPPKISNHYDNPYLIGVANLNGKIILLLETSKLLDMDMFTQLQSATE